MATKIYTVTGMTCEHCTSAVKEEVAEIPGVTSANADLDTGKLTVNGEDFTDSSIEEAVKEAGYTVTT